MLVYRDGRRRCAAERLAAGLARSLHGLADAAPARRQELLLDALLRSGELECGLADAASAHASILAELTDRLADALLAERSPTALSRDREHDRVALAFSPAVQAAASPAALAAEVHRWTEALDRVSGDLHVSPPEGFAYYGLHPLSYADAIARLEMPPRVAVIGIRSIGTTLSAIVSAAARRRGLASSRITVRPAGHPFDRRTDFSKIEGEWVQSNAAAGALFLIVDEGPGLSGSSLLSVADALAEHHVPGGRSVALCSYRPDPAALRAPRAAERWARLTVAVAGCGTHLPSDAAANISGGQWRRLFWQEQDWPAAWPSTERLKYLSEDSRRLWKFEGYGRFGAAVLESARILADAGFAPPPIAAEHGFACYPWLAGRPLGTGALGPARVEHLARYCAFRAREFAAGIGRPGDLAEMLRVNAREEFGIDLEVGAPEIVRPVIADAHMQPHEWIAGPDGRPWKCDAASHGDDHFWPGPVDIAWDLAGAIVEWQMEPAAAAAFLAHYARCSGDDPQPRLWFYLAAYAAFRLGFCRMASGATDDAERERLTRAAGRYRERLRTSLASSAAA